MEDNQIEDIDPIIQLQIKANKEKAYIKRVVNNNNINLDEKLDILISALDASKTEVEEMINFLGMELTQSQFSAARLHTLKVKERYIISSAQNASEVNLQFLHNMQAYAKYIDAEIGIIATRYKNPTSMFKEGGDVWNENVQPYLTANRQFLHKNLLLLADLKIQATSPNPTNGIELFGDNASVIVGSPRIEMRSVAVLPSQRQKFLYSTGSVTRPNFTDSVAGGKSEAHHSYGFIVVEIENDDIVHVRNVSADEEGNFNDLIYRVHDTHISREDVDCFVWGDSHFAKKDERVTFAFRTLCHDLGIKTSILHDVWDSESINVHNTKNMIVQHELLKTQKNNLENEFEQMYKELDWFEKYMDETIVVSSNHDDMLDRALQGNWYDNLVNAEMFLKLLKLKLSLKAPNGLIPYYINKRYSNIKALGINDSFVKYDVELGLHGHKGPNGSRGSNLAFSRLSQKTIIGHSHSPSIRWGCYQVGLSCRMNHGYNSGLSGWAYAGCTLNEHGKRQMIILNKETLTYTTLY